MADNLVRLVVGATDADATAHLEALKARLDEIGRKVETAKVNIDGDKAAELSLARLAMRLDAVGRKTERPNIKIDGVARAIVDAEAVSLALDHLGNKVGGGTARGGLVGMLSNLSFSLLSAGESAGTGAVGIGAILVPLAALAAIMAGPLIANLGVITLGFGAFAAGAVGEIKKVITAHQQLQAAQQAYEKATTAAGRASALHAEKVATEDLTGSEKGLLGLMGQLGHMFAKLQKAVQPEVIKAFGSALKILKDLMPSLIPLAVAAGKAIDGFLKHIDSWLHSSSGQKFLRWMEVDGPKAIATFGRVMWDVAQGVGRTFSFLRNAGEHWWTNFRAMIGAFHAGWSNTVNFFVSGGHTLESAFNTLKAAWNTTWSEVTGVLKTAWGIISGIFHEIEAAASAVAGAIGAVGSAISSVGSVGGGFLGGVGRFLTGHAAGGIVGAAAGGPRSGLTMVGERGRELVKLPAGSQVYNNSQTEQMLGGGGQLVIEIHPPAGAAVLGQEFWTAFANGIRVRGGNPQIITRKAVVA